MIAKLLVRLGLVLGLFVLGFPHLSGAGVAAPMTARPAEVSAKAFLTDIYKAYVGTPERKATGIALDTPLAVRRYFSPGLASLILDEGRDAARRGQPIIAGSDPFIGREEWQIADLAVDVKEGGPTKAVGTVRFTNFGQPDKIVVELLKVGEDWRIAEIQWGPLTLRGVYRKKWQAALDQAQVTK